MTKIFRKYVTRDPQVVYKASKTCLVHCMVPGLNHDDEPNGYVLLSTTKATGSGNDDNWMPLGLNAWVPVQLFVGQELYVRVQTDTTAFMSVSVEVL